MSLGGHFRMKLPLNKLEGELRALTWAFAYFVLCFGLILVLKRLFLAEYHIRVHGLSLVFIAAFISAKVALVFDHLPISRRLREKVIAADLAIRTGLYVAGGVLLLFVEKAFETRHEYGGFGIAFAHVLEREDANHLWATLICAGISFLGYNLLVALKASLHEESLFNFFFTRRGRELFGASETRTA